MIRAADPESPAAAASRTPKSRSRVRFNQIMRWVRRSHLYAGLFMTPWVFLYGISGMLFNHPDAFSDQQATYFDGGLGAEARVHADGLAGQVVQAFNRNAPTGEATPYKLIDPGRAEFNRDLIATAKAGGRSYNVRVDLHDGSGSARDVARKPSESAPFVTKGGVKLDPPPFEAVAKGLPAILSRAGLPVEEAAVRAAPDLVFWMEGRGRSWRVTYNGQTGAVTGRPAEADASPTARRSMILMHVAHGFPSRINARWAWAIAVDVMAVSMVGWGISGLLMWWQMKNVRLVGLVILIASLIAATAVAIGMHSAFLAEGLS